MSSLVAGMPPRASIDISGTGSVVKKHGTAKRVPDVSLSTWCIFSQPEKMTAPPFVEERCQLAPNVLPRLHRRARPPPPRRRPTRARRRSRAELALDREKLSMVALRVLVLTAMSTGSPAAHDSAASLATAASASALLDVALLDRAEREQAVAHAHPRRLRRAARRHRLAVRERLRVPSRKGMSGMSSHRLLLLRDEPLGTAVLVEGLPPLHRIVPQEGAALEVLALRREGRGPTSSGTRARRLVGVQDHVVALAAAAALLRRAGDVLARVRLQRQDRRQRQPVLVRDRAPNPLDEADEVERRRRVHLGAVVEVELLELVEPLEVVLVGSAIAASGRASTRRSIGRPCSAAPPSAAAFGVVVVVENVAHPRLRPSTPPSTAAACSTLVVTRSRRCSSAKSASKTRCSRRGASAVSASSSGVASTSAAAQNAASAAASSNAAPASTSASTIAVFLAARRSPAAAARCWTWRRSRRRGRAAAARRRRGRAAARRAAACSRRRSARRRPRRGRGAARRRRRRRWRPRGGAAWRTWRSGCWRRGRRAA